MRTWEAEWVYDLPTLVCSSTCNPELFSLLGTDIQKTVLTDKQHVTDRWTHLIPLSSIQNFPQHVHTYDLLPSTRCQSGVPYHLICKAYDLSGGWVGVLTLCLSPPRHPSHSRYVPLRDQRKTFWQFRSQSSVMLELEKRLEIIQANFLRKLRLREAKRLSKGHTHLVHLD